LGEKIERIIPDRPIASRYEGVCAVCGISFYEGELISVFFHQTYNLWRHFNCLQLWFIKPLKYAGNCNTCHSEVKIADGGYWSKTNGIWCVECGEKILPKVVIARSKNQHMKINQNYEAVNE